MAFDQPTRNRLAAFVGDARAILTEEFTHQLQADYGLNPERGEVMALDSMQLDNARRATAELLRETLDYYLANAHSQGAKARKEALERIVREQAFTVLNRLCALRMAEARGLLIESIGSGYQSKGFKLYGYMTGSALGETGDAYRTYLFSLCDELAVDLRVLFDRFSPEGRLFPGEKALLALLGAINHPDLAPLWGEDETIGWIYQYFNSQEERRQMRADSPAPRDSRELAVRNQFFTPRYVVEFLTDNTLGRIWYEMAVGRTQLANTCRYLVRRPLEVFLNPVGEVAASFGIEYDPATVPATVAAAFQGDFVTASEEESGFLRWWIAGVVSTLEYEKITGIPYSDIGDDPLLDTIWDALESDPDHPVLHHVPKLLVALGQFVRTSNGGPYAVEPFARLWHAFRHAVLGQAERQLTQEEMLRQPVYIPARQAKDPRTILMLDPACGSMHFGLYSFDLFEILYSEAWDFEATYGPKTLLRPDYLRPLLETYPDKTTFLRDVPRLIVEYNIHGIDIDPRAVQIAGLSLWLRAQRSWHSRGLKPTDRLAIRHSNVVCAEPMPGDRVALQDFVATLEPKLLGELVTTVFEKMEMAGDAGSLLEVEEEIRAAVDATQKRYQDYVLQQQKDAGYLPGLAPERETTLLDLMELPQPEQFWETAEELVVKALKEYAATATVGHSYTRRLFAQDAERGFAFIDVCRKRYDVVLMNPPFGDLALNFFDYGSAEYPMTKYDLGTMFIQRTLAWLVPNGRSGWITSRTWMALSLLEEFRVRFLYDSNRLELVADLGIGVLEALVETAACVLSFARTSGEVQVYRLLDSKEKERDLNRLLQEPNAQVFVRQLRELFLIPRHAFGYWLPEQFIERISHLTRLEQVGGSARQGLATTDDYRFLRAMWEVPSIAMGWGKRWVPLAKGGEYEPYYDDIHLVIDYDRDGIVLKVHLVENKNQSHWSRRIASSEYYGRPGLTYPERTTSDLSLRPLPAGSIFTATGQAVFLSTTRDALAYLGLSYTRVFKMLIELFVGAGDASESGSAARDYTSGILNQIPIPAIREELAHIGDLTEKAILLRRMHFQCDEVSIDFVAPTLLSLPRHSILADGLEQAYREYWDQCYELLQIAGKIDKAATRAYEIDPEILDAEICPFPTDYPKLELHDLGNVPGLSSLVQETCLVRGFRRAFTKKAYWSNRVLELIWHRAAAQIIPDELSAIASTSRHLDQPIADILSYAMGVAVGRWDIRVPLGQRTLFKSPDPFDALPNCPPGMLQNDAGLPASEADLPAGYPVRIAWPGILVGDPGHDDDAAGRIREVLAILWPEAHDSIEQDICRCLGVTKIDEYLADSNYFFDAHLKRYSKSRRQAPIYWPISTASGTYTLWLYYHRLTDQTLYRAVNDFAGPKRDDVSEELGKLLRKTNRTLAEERAIERLTVLERELTDLCDELLRVAAFWKPNLNDGVQITAAPLYRLFNHRAWRNRLRETWEKLEVGEYDWSHLAYSIWPERVCEKCRTDKSLAIAHNLEHLYRERPTLANSKGKGRKNKATQDVDSQVEMELGDVD